MYLRIASKAKLVRKSSTMVLQPCSKPLHCNSSGVSFIVIFESCRTWNKPEKAHFYYQNSNPIPSFLGSVWEQPSLSIQLCFVLTFRLISGSNISDVSMLNSAMPLSSVVKLSVFLLLTNSWITSLERGELSLSTSLICGRECETGSACYLSVCRY